MARRLGTVGYYVMLPNLSYRSNVEELAAAAAAANVDMRQKALQLMATINIPLVMQDVDALLAFAGQDKAASRGPMGCVGYCMSGQYAINAAVRHKERIRAAASMYGVALVTDKPDSPHLAPQRTDARLYFGCAEKDQYAPPEMIERLRAEIAAKGGNAEVEIYPGTGHGFAFPSRPVYDKPAAERHWERLFTLFGAALK
jgi:carboxymethylenebutenolidase